MANVHTFRYEQLTEKLNSIKLFVDSYQTILEILNQGPLTNEVKQAIENVEANILKHKDDIKTIESSINDINELKTTFDERLNLPSVGISSKYRTEDLLLSVPVFDDKKDNVKFTHFWKKLCRFSENHHLSQEAIKTCLDSLLMSNAFDIYDFIREKPLSEVIAILKDHFAVIETMDDKLRELQSMERKQNESIASCMARYSLILLKTKQIVKPDEQDQRYSNKMKDYLIKSCSQYAKERIENYISNSIRNGLRPSYAELFKIAKQTEKEKQFEGQHYCNMNMLTRSKKEKDYRDPSYRDDRSESSYSSRQTRSSTRSSNKASNHHPHLSINDPKFQGNFNNSRDIFTDHQGITWYKTNPHITDQHNERNTHRDRSPLRTTTECLTKTKPNEQKYDKEKPPRIEKNDNSQSDDDDSPTEPQTKEKLSKIQHHYIQPQPTTKNHNDIVAPPRTTNIPMSISRPSSTSSQSSHSLTGRKNDRKINVIRNFFPQLYGIKCKKCGETNFIDKRCYDSTNHAFVTTHFNNDESQQVENHLNDLKYYYKNLPESVSWESYDNPPQSDNEPYDSFDEDMESDDTEQMDEEIPFLTESEKDQHTNLHHCGLISAKLDDSNTIKREQIQPPIQAFTASCFMTYETNKDQKLYGGYTKDELVEEQAIDAYCIKIKQKDELPTTYSLKDSILMKEIAGEEKPVLPKELLGEMMTYLHMSKHLTKDEIINNVTSIFYRPDLGKIVKKQIENCNCKPCKNNNEAPIKEHEAEKKTALEVVSDDTKAEDNSSSNQEQTASTHIIQSAKENSDTLTSDTDLENSTDDEYSSLPEQLDLTQELENTNLKDKPRAVWNISIIKNRYTSRGYKYMYLFKDEHSDFRILYPSKTNRPHEIVKYLALTIKNNGCPFKLKATRNILSSRNLQTFCHQRNISLEISMRNNFDDMFETLIKERCIHHEWIYLVDGFQEFINNVCLKFLGQQQSPNSIQFGKSQEQLNIHTSSQFAKQFSETFGNPLHMTTGIYEHDRNQVHQIGEVIGIHGNNTPYEILNIQGPQVVLKDFNYPPNYRFCHTQNLTMIQTPGSEHGMRLTRRY